MLRISAASRRFVLAALLPGGAAGTLFAAANSRLTGRVVDSSVRPVPGAVVLVRNTATLVERSARTNHEGVYDFRALPVGSYRLQVSGPGFRLFVMDGLITDVASTLVRDIELQVGDISQQITVQSDAALVDAATVSVGSVIGERTVQEMPLNGRYFLDLALLAPGSTTPPQSGFSTTPDRGLGAFAINTGGNREETVNYMINGITLNNLTFSSILFQPSISAIREFKIDNSTFSAEHGQSSGAVVNLATRSGGSHFHGELFEFLRNDALDARNFFTLTSSEPPPFKRNQFGGNLGGPVSKHGTFFFVFYEGLRQSQKVDLNSLVLSDAERESTTGVVAKLAALIPRPNFVDSAGVPRFIGSAAAPVRNDQWGLDLSHDFGPRDRLHGYYSFNLSKSVQPNFFGNTIPGFGHTYEAARQFFSFGETHTFGSHGLNEARFGFNRLSGSSTPNARLNPADFGIRNGIDRPTGLPQVSVAGGGLNFGGPSNFPSGRGDTTFVVANIVSCLCGRHSLKAGGEFRQFLNNNFRLGAGTFNFPSVAAFLAGSANAFSVTLGNQSSSIAQGALGAFVQSNYRWRPNLTFELGVRYDWNVTPSERYGRFIIFDPGSASLVRRGKDGADVYRQNGQNFQPRLGFAWDPFRDGRTSVRAAYAILVDQPMTSVVTGTAGNPPLAIPLAFSGPIRFENALDLAQSVGLAPVTVDGGFHNAYVQSWNFNVQRELLPGVAATAGYFGSKGTNLILRRNLNQPLAGLRRYPAVSASSPILPGAPLGNITQAEGSGNSSYHGLWVSAAKPLARGLHVNASYSWSKSLDYNSLSSQGVVVQDSSNLRGDRALSDFDARHRFVASAIYQLPFRGSRWVDNWQFGVVLQAQTGNPVNIVTTNTSITGVANTVRPDVTGPIAIPGAVDRWFDTSVFTPVSRFGDLARNVVAGPGFHNIDLSVLKNTRLKENLQLQFRGEIFDLLNHANFGQPGRVAGSPGFGRIVNTRFPTGESGSSRQAQFAVKVVF